MVRLPLDLHLQGRQDMYVGIVFWAAFGHFEFWRRQPPRQGIFARLARTLDTPSFSSGPVGTVPSWESHVTDAPK